MIKFSNKLKYVFITGLCLLILFASLIAFIKIDPNAAGNFADSILRPTVGADNVLALERIFFNSSDDINQVIYKIQKPSPPQFSNTPSKANNLSFLKSLDHVSSLDPITSLHYFPYLPNEGQWQQVNFGLFPSQLVATTTFVRPDPKRSYAIVDILQMDMTKMKMGLVAGTESPGGVLGNKGPGIVPLDIQNSNELIAAFSGGFQYSDGQYGMVVGDKTYVPLKKNTASLVIHKNGKIEIINYTGQDLGTDVTGIRQNCPMLIENGQVTAATSLGESAWGWTDNASNMYTIRTAIGTTKNGSLLFAVGKSLVPKTLGNALKSAGAINAMQLDMNPSWTRFVIYNSLGNGKYTYSSYDKSLVNGGYAYLHGWHKDFIYLYKDNG